MFAQKNVSSSREKFVREREREREKKYTGGEKRTQNQKKGGTPTRAQNRVIYTYTRAVVYEEDKEIQNERKKRR